MKLLLVQETDWLRKPPIQHHHLAEMLSMHGHQVRVIDYALLWQREAGLGLWSGRKVFPDVARIHREAKVTVVRPGMVRLPVLEYASLAASHAAEIDRQLKEFRPDAVVGLGIINAYLALRACRKYNVPFLYHWLDLLHLLVPVRVAQPIARMLEGRTLARADSIITVSDNLKDCVVKLGAPPERVNVLRPGISLERFTPALDGKPVRERYGIAPDDIVLFFMGWLYHFAGLKEVALEMAKSGDRRFKLLIVGEGDAYNELQHLRDSHGLQDRVILTGKKPYEEIPGLVAASDICLLPSYPNEKIMQDGLPAKVFEYMAMKKPVLSTRLAAVFREFGESSGIVFVEKPEDVLARAGELVKDSLVQKLGERARQCMEKYSWDNILREYQQILMKAIEEKKNGRNSYAGR